MVAAWLFGTIAGDIYLGSPLTSRAKGIARVVFFAFDFMALAIVINNKTQFAGFSNVSVPGAGVVDFAAMATAAGYASAIRIDSLASLKEKITGILASMGPVFIELAIAMDAPSLSRQAPQKEWSEVRFTRMGDEARSLRTFLGRAL